MSNELKLTDEVFDTHVVVSIAGEVDIYTSKSLKEKLYDVIEQRQIDLKLDCKDLNYIDSTGLGIFVGALKKAKQYNKKIYISGLKDNIKKLFVITGLDKVFVLE